MLMLRHAVVSWTRRCSTARLVQAALTSPVHRKGGAVQPRVGPNGPTRPWSTVLRASKCCCGARVRPQIFQSDDVDVPSARLVAGKNESKMPMFPVSSDSRLRLRLRSVQTRRGPATRMSRSWNLRCAQRVGHKMDRRPMARLEWLCSRPET
jgi:hypothetical protein